MKKPYWRNEGRMTMKLSVYKGRCGRGKGRYFIALVTIWKTSGERIQRYSICCEKSNKRLFEKHWHFENLDAAQQFLDDMADARKWRYIMEYEALPEYEFYSMFKRKGEDSDVRMAMSGH